MKRNIFKNRLIIAVAMVLTLALALCACGKGSLTSSDLKSTTAAAQVSEGKTTEETAKADKEQAESTKKTESTSVTAASESSGETTKTAEEKSSSQETTRAAETTQATEATKPSETTTEETTTEPAPQTTSVYITVDGGAAGCFFSGEIVYEGSASVFDILCMTGVEISGSSSYVSAINGLAEKEHGPMSGWLYMVNGNTPMISCGAYFINPGDDIYWYYQYDE